MRTPVLLPVLAVVLVLAGCGTQAGGGATPTSTPPASQDLAAVPVTIKRSGGFAGVDQTIVLSPDGSWVYTDGRQNKTERGTLNDLQRAQVVTLVSAPGFAQALAGKATTTAVCNDGFEYTISLGTKSFSVTDCGQVDAPIQAVIAALSDATPF